MESARRVSDLTAEPRPGVTDEVFMAEAVVYAMEAKAAGNLPFGAVVVHNGVVIAGASDQLAVSKDVTAHAEMLALSMAGRRLNTLDLSTCTLYSTAEPCVMCGSATLAALIPRVVIGVCRDDVPHFFKHRHVRFQDLFADAYGDVDFRIGVLRDEILPLFDGVARSNRYPDSVAVSMSP